MGQYLKKLNISDRKRLLVPLVVIVAIGGLGAYFLSTGHAQTVTTTPIQHVIVIMEENHTFDNYFGDFTPNPGNTTPTLDPAYADTEPQAPNPMPHDVLHSGPRAIAAIDSGKMDDFDPLGMFQFKQSDIPIYWSYAEQYGLGANFYTDAETSSTPNHISMLAAQTGGDFQTSVGSGCKADPGAIVLNRDTSGNESYGTPCYNINSIPQEMTNAGLTWKFYGTSGIWDPPLFISSLANTPSSPDTQIISDINNNALPAVSFVTPDTVLESDHMPEPTQPAQNFVSNIVNTVMNSPDWSSTAVFVTWDDFGGWYDHMPPPQEDGRGLGDRVPLLVISPYAKQGYISYNQSEFASFDKFIEENWQLPSLNQRDSLSTTSDLMDYFDFSGATNNPTDIQQPLSYSTVLEPPTDNPAAVGGAGQASTVKPAAGGPGTLFTYSVIYSDSAPPVTHNVIVDGTPIVMNPVQSVGTNEEEYQASTTLSPSSASSPHTYTFQFNDGTNTYNLPTNNVSYTGPIVAPFNLSGITIAPSGGIETGQPITINTVYTSPAGLTPTVANIVIDGQSYPMTAIRGTASKGIHYEFSSSTLATGAHYFQLEFNDGGSLGLQDFQESTFNISPIVMHQSSVTPTSGNTKTIFTFSTVYYNASNAPPQTIELVVNQKKTYPMTLVSGTPATGATYSVNLTLSAGKHTFSFYASDGTNSWSNPITGTFSGIQVVKAGQALPQTTTILSPSDLQDPYAFDAN